MALTIFPSGFAGTLKIIRESDLDETANDNVADGAATIYALDIDNAANAAITYVKTYNNADPTVGTTDPEMILMLTASVRRTFIFRTGNAAHSTALSMAAVTAAGTAGVTGPTSNVIADIGTG